MEIQDFTGQILDGKYLLTRKLGQGGMGAVYEGKHVTVGKMVAVKILHAALIANEELVRRFIREAQAAVAIAHKNIIDVVDLGALETGEPYIVMEYLTGADLDGLIGFQKHLDLATASAILEPTLRAVQAAHDKGVVHRDLKPENIFINVSSDGVPEVKVIDFGISKIQDNQVTKLTQDGATLGTPAYMSPEQVKGSAELNHLADIYALGIIFYEMLAGDTPHEGELYHVLLSNILTSEPRHPQSVYPDFPMDAWPFIEKAIARDPKDRYQSADEMRQALKSLVGDGDRLASFEALPAAIDRIRKSKKEKSAKAGIGGGAMAASDILQDLAMQNTKMVAPTMALNRNAADEAKTSSDNGPDFLAKSATILIGAQKEIVKRAPGAKRVLASLARRLGGMVKYVLMQSERRLYYRIASGVLLVAAVLWMVVDVTVEIEIVGMPEKGVIYYNNHPVDDNPFDVVKDDKRVPVRVEVKDRTKMRFTVVPNDDLRIQYIPGGRKARLVDASGMETEAPQKEAAPKKSTAPEPRNASAAPVEKKEVRLDEKKNNVTPPEPESKGESGTASQSLPAVRSNDGKSNGASGAKEEKKPFKKLRRSLRKLFNK
ncbi:MAG: serine/threonine protein kinase [Deltaproteobacteria bacterium]|nr:serine/threonine protein kinase [Deltaproteobacteria bacterium]